jgi:hypothetical protein
LLCVGIAEIYFFALETADFFLEFLFSLLAFYVFLFAGNCVDFVPKSLVWKNVSSSALPIRAGIHHSEYYLLQKIIANYLLQKLTRLSQS